jgi:hypothetical protein
MIDGGGGGGRSLLPYLSLVFMHDNNQIKLQKINMRSIILHNQVFGHSTQCILQLCGAHCTDEESRPSPDPITLLHDQKMLIKELRMGIQLSPDKHTRNQVCRIGTECSIPHPSLVPHKLLLERRRVVVLNLPYLDGRIG